MEALRGVDISVSVFSKQVYDVAFFYRLLMDLPTVAGLVALGPPIIYSFPSVHVPTEHGFTGVNVMVESHVAFHHWPEQGYIHLTISSCKAVNETEVLRWLCQKFRGNRNTIRMSSLPWEPII